MLTLADFSATQYTENIISKLIFLHILFIFKKKRFSTKCLTYCDFKILQYLTQMLCSTLLLRFLQYSFQPLVAALSTMLPPVHIIDMKLSDITIFDPNQLKYWRIVKLYDQISDYANTHMANVHFATSLVLSSSAQLPTLHLLCASLNWEHANCYLL